MAKYKQVKVNFKHEDFEKLELLANYAELSKAELIRKSLGNFLSLMRGRKKDYQKYLQRNYLWYEQLQISIKSLGIATFISKWIDKFYPT